MVSSYTGSSTLRSHSSEADNGDLSHTHSPYQAKRTSGGGKLRYEPVYLREILNSDLGYPTSTPVSTVRLTSRFVNLAIMSTFFFTIRPRVYQR